MNLKTKEKMSEIVVVDTNIFVSYFLTPNKTTAVKTVVNRILCKEATPVYSTQIMVEYVKVLKRPKFNFPNDTISRFLKLICDNGLYVNPLPTSMPFIDLSDKCFYDAALTAHVDYLITGNKRHFPDEPFIVAPAEYLQRVGSSANSSASKGGL